MTTTRMDGRYTTAGRDRAARRSRSHTDPADYNAFHSVNVAGRGSVFAPLRATADLLSMERGLHTDRAAPPATGGSGNGVVSHDGAAYGEMAKRFSFASLVSPRAWREFFATIWQAAIGNNEGFNHTMRQWGQYLLTMNQFVVFLTNIILLLAATIALIVAASIFIGRPELPLIPPARKAYYSPTPYFQRGEAPSTAVAAVGTPTAATAITVAV